MVRGGDLRKAFRLGGIRLVTADAQYGRVELRGLHRRVIGMLRQWSVTRLAVDLRMPAALLLLQDIRVAAFAGLMAGEVHGPGSNLADRISAIVTVLSETLWHEDLHASPETAGSRQRKPQPAGKGALRL